MLSPAPDKLQRWAQQPHGSADELDWPGSLIRGPRDINITRLCDAFSRRKDASDAPFELPYALHGGKNQSNESQHEKKHFEKHARMPCNIGARHLGKETRRTCRFSCFSRRAQRAEHAPAIGERSECEPTAHEHWPLPVLRRP